jgi:hypothetical protein
MPLPLLLTPLVLPKPLEEVAKPLLEDVLDKPEELLVAKPPELVVVAPLAAFPELDPEPLLETPDALVEPAFPLVLPVLRFSGSGGGRSIVCPYGPPMGPPDPPLQPTACATASTVTEANAAHDSKNRMVAPRSERRAMPPLAPRDASVRFASLSWIMGGCASSLQSNHAVGNLRLRRIKWRFGLRPLAFRWPSQRRSYGVFGATKGGAECVEPPARRCAIRQEAP